MLGAVGSQLDEDLAEIHFDEREWSVWSSYRAWLIAEEKEIEDEEEFKQKLRETHRMSENEMNCLFTLGVFRGERDADQERHGAGQTLFPNSDTFEGYLEHGKRTGFGRYTWNSVRENRLDRRILKTFQQWETYTKAQHSRGEAFEEKNDFLGRLSTSLSVHLDRIHIVLRRGNGHPFYEGGFLEDKKHGEGVYKTPDGAIYIGQFFEDQRSGEGLYIYPNSDVYSGQWKEGKKHGPGFYQFCGKNCRYVGEWVDGALIRGVWELCDGVRFEGSFFDTTPKPKQRGEDDEEMDGEDDAESQKVTVRKTYPCGPGQFLFPSGFSCRGEFSESDFQWCPDLIKGYAAAASL